MSTVTSKGGRDDVLVPALLREVNQRIREVAADFGPNAEGDPPQEYLCECGCGRWVSLSTSEFDDRVAIQRPVALEGHVLARAHAARQLSRRLREEAAALRAEARQKHRKNDQPATRKLPFTTP
jgi:hypothetical protein